MHRILFHLVAVLALMWLFTMHVVSWNGMNNFEIELIEQCSLEDSELKEERGDNKIDDTYRLGSILSFAANGSSNVLEDPENFESSVHGENITPPPEIKILISVNPRNLFNQWA